MLGRSSHLVLGLDVLLFNDSRADIDALVCRLSATFLDGLSDVELLLDA